MPKRGLRKHFELRRVYVTYLVCFIIIALTMVLSIILAILDKTDFEDTIEHIGLCLQALALLSIPILMRAKLKFRIPAFMQIIVAIFIVAHCILGEIVGFYDYIFLFDKVLHTTAGIIIALLGFSIVYGFSRTESGQIKLSSFFVALFSFCFTLALLTLWEVFEYTMDVILSTNMQRWQDALTELEIDGTIRLITSVRQGSGLVDTMSDIIVGIIGAIVICVIGGILIKKFPNNTRFFVVRIKHEENEQKPMENCIFCKIIDEKIPSTKMYEDESILIFKDIEPKAEKHYIAILKKHFAYLSDMKGEDFEAVGKMLNKISLLQKELELENGYRIIINQGADAGQTVFHLHLHILGGQKLEFNDLKK